MHAIETKGLTKYYGKARGIVDLNFNINEGEIFGFIGPNGAGKSTTIRTLLNLIYPSRGSAKVLGFDIVRESHRLKHYIGYLPSEVAYYDKLKINELLAYSARFYNIKLDKWYQYLIDTFNVDLKERIEDLSTGNRKKVAIIQALLHKPKLLILDEPTGGLDPLMQNKFFEFIN